MSERVMESRPAATLVTTLSAGGPFERIARWLAQGFAELERRFDVVFLDRVAGSSMTASGREVRLATRARSSIPALRRYFRSARPRLVLATPGFVAPFAIVAGRIAGVPTVPWEAGFFERELADLPRKMRLGPLLQRVTYPMAPAWAAVSKSVANSLVTRVGSRSVHCTVIPNPLDANEIRSRADGSAVRRRSSEEVVTMCSVGGLTGYKGMDVLLDSFARARGIATRALRLVIVGEGPQRAALEAKIASLSLTADVTLVGHMDNPYPVMAEADFLVHPALVEGFGVVITEALALDLPVVATSSGGPEEILGRGRHGVLVPPGDAPALAGAIVRMAEDEGLRTELSSRAAHAIERYRPARVAELVLALAARLEQHGA